jgi:hypothetical protein
LLDLLLAVDLVLLRDHVDDLAIGWNRNRLRLLDDAFDIAGLYLLVPDRDHADLVSGLDVSARDACIDRVDLAARHELRFFGSFPNGLDRGINIDHHTSTKSLGWVTADPDDVDALCIDLRDHGADLRRADVESDYQFFIAGHPLPPLLSCENH